MDTEHDHNGHADPGNNIVADTTAALRSSLQYLHARENRLATDLADIREKRVAAERALATFSGDAPKKRRGRPRKQPETT
jgi:hypothetical protein